MKEQKINIILKYGERINYFETYKYKNLNILVEKAYKYFYPLNGEIELFWNNKNLTEYLDKPIGLVFNNQKKVKIIVAKSQFEYYNNNLDTINHKNIKNKIKNRMGMNFLFEKNNSTTNLNISKKFMKSYDILNHSSKINNNNNNINVNKSSNNVLNNNNNYNSFINMKSNFTGKKKLPPIKNINNNNNNNNNNFSSNFNEININEKNINNNNNNILCYICHKNPIVFYCRNDNIFLCNFCYNEKSNHINHKVFYITNDIKKNINNYKEEMIRDLKETEFLYKNLHLLKDKEINIKNWEKTFENILENIKNVSEKLNKKISLNDEFKINNIENNNNSNINTNSFENVDEEYERIRNDLDNINCDDKNNNNPVEIFNRINNNEKQIENLFYNSKKYNKKKEIKEKIEKIYYDINNEIDNVIDVLNKEFEL